MDGGATDTRRFRVLLSLSSLVAAVTATLVVFYPFTGDQALFSVFGRMISEGANLYVDVWDVKQPGIFWLFALSHELFGPAAVSAHVLESIVWIGGSVGLALSMRRFLHHTWIAGLVPLLGGAMYFGIVTSSDLTQVESLMSIPLAGVVVLLSSVPGRSRKRWATFSAGLLAGLVGVFKMLALLAPLAVFSVAILISRRRRESASEVEPLTILPFVAGLSIPIVAVIGWVFFAGIGDVVWFTWFEYPPEMLPLAERPITRLVRGAAEYGALVALLVVLAGIGLARRSERSREFVWLGATAVLMSVVLVLLQLWWGYLFFLTLAPLALLALIGLDELFKLGIKRWMILAAVVLLIPVGYRTGQKATEFSALIVERDLDSYRNLSDSFSSAVREASELDIDRRTDIYVFGNPAILDALEANQAIPINGWSPEFWTLSLWQQVELQIADEDFEWLYIADWANDLIARRYPEFEKMVSREFETHRLTADGRWLSRR